MGGAGDPRCYTKSRLGALKAGQAVTCTGRGACTGTYLIAMVQGYEARAQPKEGEVAAASPSQLRRMAIVANVDGKLAFAQLLSDEEGHMLADDPPMFMLASELGDLQEQVDSFLSQRKVSAAYKSVMRAPMAPSQLTLRPRLAPIEAVESPPAMSSSSTRFPTASLCRERCEFGA